jgi:16S rRNA (guanine1207-N2)-methyltransferase
MTEANAAFTALWHPFLTGAIAWSDSSLFLRARAGKIPDGIKTQGVDCVQSFKPFADELQRSGFSLLETIDKKYPLVLVLPPPQRDEARALFVQALQHAEEGGIVVVSMENNEGAKSGEKDLRQLAPDLQSVSKNKCRIFWGRKQRINEALMHAWSMQDAPRLLETTGFISRPGIFAWNRIDAASKLLASYLPDDLAGYGADLGAGFGYLTHAVLMRNKNIDAMDVFEAEARALECAKLNLARFEAGTKLAYHWQDVTQGIPGLHDFVVSNPPFHAGHAEIQAIGQAFIKVAAESLRPGGGFYMVANRHLPYEESLRNHFSNIDVLAVEDGYKVFKAVR